MPQDPAAPTAPRPRRPRRPRQAEAPGGAPQLPTTAEAPHPWLLIHLCPVCQRRRETGELTEQHLRAARFALDRHRGAARHYAAYLDQLLLGAEPALDMNIAGSALAIIKADPDM
ncbi:hypothetical protein OG906_42490 (plasmid) [Streptomyces sp. NBC_01426]|uniref:hypothetical protein n=1 Tax=Streptomyces sp. NBC_01426 TaxID=2975866 RepID=UPI002E34836B|nr:hypothetical protein [Streptomyces sp. NBC_01426]